LYTMHSGSTYLYVTRHSRGFTETWNKSIFTAKENLYRFDSER
jgi:hypothetical protein